MSWATRTTTIIGIPWGLFVLFLMASTGQHATPQFLLFWFLIFGVPLAVIWTLLFLILGDRGKIVRY